MLLSVLFQVIADVDLDVLTLLSSKLHMKATFSDTALRDIDSNLTLGSSDISLFLRSIYLFQLVKERKGPNFLVFA